MALSGWTLGRSYDNGHGAACSAAGRASSGHLLLFGGCGRLDGRSNAGKGLSVAPVGREFERDMTEITNFQPPHNPLDIIKARSNPMM